MSEYDDLLARVRSDQPAPAQEDYSGLLARVRGQPDPSAVQANLNIVSFKKPDQEAERQVLARQLKEKLGEDWSPMAVDPQEAQRRLRVVENDHALRNSPKLAQKFMDQGFAGMAHDDVLNLSELEKQALFYGELKGSAGPEANLSALWRGLVRAFPQGLEATRQGLRQQFADFMGFDGMAEDARRKSTAVQTDVIINSPQFESSTASGLYSGGVSLVRQTPGLIASLLTRSTAPMLATAGLQTEAEAYSKYRNRGGTAGESFIGATGEGATEVITEKLPMGFLVNKLGKAGAGEFLKGFLGRELAGEEVATFVQDAIDTAVANPDKTWGQFWQERPDAAYQTALATLVQTGAMGGLHVAAQRLGGKEQQAQQAEQLTHILEGMNKLAEASKLRERDVESAAGYFQTLMEEGRDAVWIAPEALAQSGLAEQIAQAIPGVSEQLESAIQTGHDVRLPIADLMARMPGDALAQSILPHVADEPGGFTRTTAQEYLQSGQAQELQALVEQTLSEKQGNDALRASAQEVEADVLAQLNTTGRFTTDANQAYAKLMAEFFTVMAERTGMAPGELYQRYRPTIVAEGVVKGLNQAAVQTETPEFKTWFGDSKVVDAEGKPLVVYHGTASDVVQFDPLLLGGNTKAKSAKSAFFLTSSPKVASGYAVLGRSRAANKGAVIEAAMQSDVLSEDMKAFLKKELDRPLTDKENAEWVEWFGEVFGSSKGEFIQRGANVLPVYIRLENPLVVDYGGLDYRERAFSDVIRQAREEGRDGVIFKNAEDSMHKDFAEVSDIYAVLKPEQIKSATGNRGTFDPNDPNILNQSDTLNRETRGAFNPSSRTIGLFQAADLSTFLHESGHFFLEVMADIASQPDAPAAIVADMDATLQWFGIQGSPNASALEVWNGMTLDEKRPYHEKWAESFEQYLMTGKTPSLELRQAFQKFKDWLLRIYQSLKQFAAGHPTADLSPEISQVFDRLLAADEQIKLAEQARSMIALFESADQAGMTPEEFAAYQALGQDATETAREELEAKGIRDMKWLANARSRALKALQAEAKGARSLVMMEARREVMSQPVYQAWQFLTGKAGEKTEAQKQYEAALGDWNKDRADFEQKTREDLRAKLLFANPDAKGLAKGQLIAKNKRQLDIDTQQALLDWDKDNAKPEAPAAPAEGETAGGNPFGRLGLEALKEMGLPVELINHLKTLRMTAKDGWHPDQVAERYGFNSGEELVRTIAAAPTPKEAIEALTDRLMIERHAELSSPEAIERAADEAIHNDARARMVETELNALARAAGKRNILRSAAKEYAAAIIGRLKVKDLRPSQYAVAEARAAREAEKATRSGDLEAAAVEKRNQLLNLYATKAALEARREIEGMRREWSEFANRSDKKLGKSYDIDIVNAVRAVLGEYGVAEKRAKKAAEYLKAVQSYDPEMFGVLNASVEAAEANAKPWKDMTVEEVRGLRDEVEAMLHLAKRSRQMEVDGDMIDRQEVEDALLGRLNEIGIPDRIPGEGQAVTPGEQMMTKFRTFVSAARRMESWVGSVDGDAPMGPFRRFVWSRIKDAADSYRADKAKFLKQFRQAFDGIAPTLKPQLIAAPELNYTFGKDTGGSAMNEILHALLHTGNASNKRKLLLGRGWAKELPDGSLDTRAWDGFIGRLIAEGKLTKAHYDFAQTVWDLLETTKPLAQKTHRDVFGKYFDEVTADEFTTPFGVYRGGYVPAMADSRVVRDAELRKLVEDENAALAFAFPTTPKGFTKARVEYNRPLLLDLRSIAQHIDKVLLFAHMEMPVRDVQRVLSQEVGKALGRVDPTAIPAMITPWLNRSAKQQVETPIPGSAGTMRFFSVLRSRAGAAAMFANLTNAVQQITGFSIAAVKVPPRLMLSATADFMKGPKAFTKAVAEASPFMAERMANEVAAMTGEINDILLNPSLLEKGQHWTMRHAYFLQSAIDNTMSPIIWTAAYNQAMEQGMEHRDAVRMADSTIRETQGSTLPEDISRIESGNAFVRLFTQFAGYFNMQANLLGTEFVKLSRDYGLKNSAGRGFYVFTMGFLIPAVMSELIVQAFRGGPDDEDKDGEYLDDWLSALFMGQVRTLTAMVPVLGQLVLGAINASNKKPYDDRLATPPVISMLESAIRAPFTLKDFAEGEAGAQKTVRDVATLVSMTLGLPANALARPLGYGAGVADGRIVPTGPVDVVRGTVTGIASADSKY